MKCGQVDGCVDPDVIADNYVSHFRKAFNYNNPVRAESLKADYLALRGNYSGYPVLEEQHFDIEVVSNIIFNHKHGKAAGTGGLSVKHLQLCHPVMSVILDKLFQLMLLCSYVSSGFRYSYIVPTLNQRIVTVKPLRAMISQASPSVQLYQKFLNTASLINLNPFSLHLTASLVLRKDVNVALPSVQLDLLLLT